MCNLTWILRKVAHHSFISASLLQHRYLEKGGGEHSQSEGQRDENSTLGFGGKDPRKSQVFFKKHMRGRERTQYKISQSSSKKEKIKLN